MTAPKMTNREKALAKRVGAGGTEFVLARRKRPGMSLLEFQARRGDVDELDSTEVERVPTPDPAPAPAKKTTAPRAAKKTTSARAGR